jgi:uncharacterized Zn finger protein
MDALDGNAIAGQLLEHFGADMTMAIGSCAHCGTTRRVGELVVYGRRPGTIVRCPTCGLVVIAVVDARERTLVNVDAFKMRKARNPG